MKEKHRRDYMKDRVSESVQGFRDWGMDKKGTCLTHEGTDSGEEIRTEPRVRVSQIGGNRDRGQMSG